jgi:pyruvate/oxaloacetate carboxyltransferase
MRIKPQSDSSKKMTLAANDPLGFLNNESSGLRNNSQTDLIQAFLYEIIRVKELVKYYESIPNSGGRLGASILNELVSEAYNSLVDYDIVLMKKYYDLLLNCD